jgi:hypothetical protein
MTADGGTVRRRWAARPWRARAVRLLVYALPVAGSLGCVHLVTTIVGAPPASLWLFLVWWLAMSLTATAVVAVAYALLRRLLPLGALLELSLVFPDEAPSRFRLALHSGTVDSLEERLSLMKAAHEATSAQQAAEILIRLAAALDVHDRSRAATRSGFAPTPTASARSSAWGPTISTSSTGRRSCTTSGSSRSARRS